MPEISLLPPFTLCHWSVTSIGRAGSPSGCHGFVIRPPEKCICSSTNTVLFMYLLRIGTLVTTVQRLRRPMYTWVLSFAGCNAMSLHSLVARQIFQALIAARPHSTNVRLNKLMPVVQKSLQRHGHGRISISYGGVGRLRSRSRRRHWWNGDAVQCRHGRTGVGGWEGWLTRVRPVT
jgi:hypothetical protein